MKIVPVRQASTAGGEIAPGLYARTDLKRYADSMRLLRNALPKQEGPSMNRPGFLYEGAAKVADLTLGLGRLYGFVFSSGTLANNFTLEFVPGFIRIWKNGALLTSGGVPIEIATPYTVDDIPRLKFTQLGQILTIFCKQKRTRELKWISDTNWTLTEFTITRAITAPTGLVITHIPPGTSTLAAKVWQVVVTAVKAETKEESLPSLYQQATMAPSNNDPAVYSWNAVAGAAEYNIYRGRNGRLGYVGTAVGVTTYSDDGEYPVYAEAPPTNRDPFTSVDEANMPQVGTYHDQRLAMANAWNNPGEIEMSRMGEHLNFDRAAPPKATDAVTLNISSDQYEEIRNLISYGRSLFVLTNGMEQLITGSEGVIWQNDIVFDDQPSRWGSSWLDAIQIGQMVLFVQDTGASIRDIFPPDKTRSNDLTLVVRHLFEGYTIRSWCYAHEPFRQLWVVRSDGALLSCTYVKELDLWAWARHDTDGDKFEDVCAVPENGEHAVRAMIQRNVNGTWRRYIERLSPRLKADWADLVFLDSAVTKTNCTTVTGLSHLIGRTVYALADGVVQGPFEVSAEGEITLGGLAAKVHVGLKITAQGHTLDLYSSEAEIRVRSKLVKQVYMEVERSMPFKAGQRLTDVLERAHKPDGSAWTEPYTGLVRVNINSDWSDEGAVVWEHTDPTPLTILSIIREVEFG